MLGFDTEQYRENGWEPRPPLFPPAADLARFGLALRRRITDREVAAMLHYLGGVDPLVDTLDQRPHRCDWPHCGPGFRTAVDQVD